MGCTQSTQVIETKQKINIQLETTANIFDQNEESNKKIQTISEKAECFLIGSLGQKQQFFAHVKLEAMSIEKMSVPSGGFVSSNFSSMLQIQKGKYFISGGINHDLTQISSGCFFYYAGEHKVEQLNNMIQARYTHSTIYIPKRKAVYIIGGRFYGDDTKAILAHCEKYDLQSRKFVELPALNLKRCTCSVFTWNDAVYAFGGYTGPFERSTLIQYLSKDQTGWKVLDVQLNRGLEGAILLPTNNNELTIFGGLTNSGPTDSVITINLEERSIRSKKKLIEKRSLYKSFYHAGKIYFFGGDQKFTCEIYDIANQKSELIIKEFPCSIENFDSFGFSTLSAHVPYKQKVESRKFSNSTQKDQIVYIIGTTEEPFLCQLNISIPEAKFINVPLNMKLYAYQGGVFINKKQLQKVKKPEEHC